VNKILYTPIGIVHSPFLEVTVMPIQPYGTWTVCYHRQEYNSDYLIPVARR